MPFLDRPSFIALLERLDDRDDAVVVGAAREVGRRLREAGLGWDELLRPGPGDEGEAPAEPEEPGAPEDAEDPPEPEDPGALADAEALDRPADAAAEDLALIERLLARATLSEATRREIEDMRADIGRGDFTARDRRYLRDLDERLARQG